MEDYLTAHQLAMIAYELDYVQGTTSSSLNRFEPEAEAATTDETFPGLGGSRWLFLNLYHSARKISLGKVAIPVVE